MPNSNYVLSVLNVLIVIGGTLFNGRTNERTHQRINFIKDIEFHL